MTRPAMFCEHANECPQTCPCAPGCYCHAETCVARAMAESMPKATMKRRLKRRERR